MNEARLLQVVLAPHISEKASQVQSDKQTLVLKVAQDATKPEIKAAVEQLFEVKVASVRVANAKGKQTRFGRILGRRKNWKKAYITLADGESLELAGEQV